MPVIQSEMDKSYILMHEIDTHQKISQRELSQKTGLSLGTVNLLLQKMIKQGLIKMVNIPANRVIYMLTPEGMAEKASKTLRYIRVHYQIIQDTIKTIQHKLNQYHQQYEMIYIFKPEHELASLLKIAVDSYLDDNSSKKVQIISKAQSYKVDNSFINCNAIILYLPDEKKDDYILNYAHKNKIPIKMLELN